ncbi:MAG: hypothetical protein JWL76_1214 [Thermoleophilia bacterium]|nr:hypothetical protein [Thermoleophilia bacterium]
MPFPRIHARATARMHAPVREDSRVGPRLRGMAVLLVAALVVATGSSFGASSSVVVTMDVPSAIQLTNGCTSTSATSFGTVLPGTGATTDTGAGRCIVSWGASNDSSMLRISQRDGVGTAMSRPSGFTGTTDWDYWTSVDSNDGTDTIAGGPGGVFARSANSGNSWTVTNGIGGNGSEVTDVEMVPTDETIAWAVGYSGRVQRISNALGVPSVTNRRTQLEAAGWPAAIEALSVVVVDVDTVFVGGDSGWIAKTDDDGLNWTAFKMPSTSYVSSLSLSPIGHVWMATAGNPGGNLFRAPIAGGTTAGGWTQYNAAVGIGLSSVYVSGAANGYAVGYDGAILSWNGATWTWRGDWTVESGGLIDVASPAGSPGIAVAVGEDGTIIRSNDGGSTWTRRPSPVGAELLAIASGTGGMVAVGTARSAVNSTDGAGLTWGFQYDSASARPRRNVALEPVDGKIAVALGTRGTIWRSTDGGTTWGTVTSGTTEPLFGVSWATRTLVWAVGGNGTILRSDDAGATWTAAVSNTTVRLRSVSAGASEQVTAVGDQGTVVRSSNGGSTFTASTIAGAPQLREVSMGSRLVGITVGNGVIKRTVDGGATWTNPTSAPAIENMYSVSMSSATAAYATSSWDGVWKTADGGATWTRTSMGANDAAHADVHAITDKVAYAVGDDVYMTTDGTTWTQVNGLPSWSKLAVAAGDENHVIVAGGVGAIYVRKASTALADQIPDYGAAPNSWAPSAQAMFGVCLQAVGAQTAQAAPWVVDGGTCTGSDGDPWRAIPIAPTKIAGVAISGNTGQVDLVWGARFPAAQAPGRYSAGVVFEAVAPNA